MPWCSNGAKRLNGGMSAAVIYSLVETAKLNGVDPHAWLTHVIANIADHPMKQIDELLPWNWRHQGIGDSLAG